MPTDNVNTLIITNEFSTTPERMFKLWTQPNYLKQWWGPKVFTTPFCEVDLRVGGAWRYCMRSPEGKDFWGKGIFQEIVEPTRLVMTDRFTNEKGNPVPASYYGMSADWPAETRLSVTFTEQKANTTQLRLEHSGISPSDQEMCEAGWRSSLERLTELLATL